MPESPLQLLFVDDDDDITKQAEEYFDEKITLSSGEYIKLHILNSFDSALAELESRRIDVVILDVRLGTPENTSGENRGIDVLEAIRQVRFVPVIFYTALPESVREYETPLIRIVEKTQGFGYLQQVIDELCATRLLHVNRALLRHLEYVQREYMWGFVASNWEKLGDTPDRSALAYLLASRLAKSLSDSGISKFILELGGADPTLEKSNAVHPMLYYVIPPFREKPLAGSIYLGKIGNQEGYWVLLTPSCDMLQGKADKVLFSFCQPLIDQKEYQDCYAADGQPSKGKLEILAKLLSNNRKDAQADRFFFLPAAIMLPDLVVDFQNLSTISINQLAELEHLASLDSPFAELLVSRFTKYLGRLGAPDLNIDIVQSKFANQSA